RGGIRRKTSGHVAIERYGPEGVRVARVNADRKTEWRGQAARDVVPATAAVGRAPDAVMVLLIEHVGRARRPHHVVHAMADLAVAGPCGMGGLGAGLRVRQPVATVPATAAVLGREDAGRRNADPDFVGIGRVE